MNADTYVRARISSETKDKAVAALDKIGLSTSDVIRLVMYRVAEEGCLPFEVAVPNRKTRLAMQELDEGKGTRYETLDDMYKDIGI